MGFAFKRRRTSSSVHGSEPFVEQGEADDADVASVVIFLGGAAFEDRTEANGVSAHDN